MTETKKGLASVWSDAADDTRAATVPCEVTYDNGKVIISFDQTVDFSKMRETSDLKGLASVWSDAADDTRAATVPCEVTYDNGKVIISFDQTVDFSKMRET